MTIREIISKKSEELRDIDSLSPTKASEELVSLSSLLASLLKHISEADFWYRIKLKDMLLEHGTAAKAKIHAEASPEWNSVNEAKAQQIALIEMIRSLKFYIKASSEEMRESKY